MSYPTFKCEDCERLCNEVEALKCALTEAHDEICTAETRGWNAAIDAELAVIEIGGWWAKVSELRKPEP